MNEILLCLHIHHILTVTFELDKEANTVKPGRGAIRTCPLRRRLSILMAGTFEYQIDTIMQGGRTWQPFVGSKNGNENFRQARIYNFHVK